MLGPERGAGPIDKNTQPAFVTEYHVMICARISYYLLLNPKAQDSMLAIGFEGIPAKI
jgi:hypothetical protein